MKKLVLMISIFLVFYAPSQITSSATYTDCILNCKDQYESQVKSCNSTYTGPGNLEVLGMCITKAKNQFYDCIKICKGEK